MPYGSSEGSASTQLNDFINDLLEKAPELAADFIEIAKSFIEKQTRPGSMPDTPAVGPIDFTNDDGSGQGYNLTTQGISDEQIAHIRQGTADGIIMEKAGEWLGGFITGLMLAAG
jgi:hypothetical protein